MNKNAFGLLMAAILGLAGISAQGQEVSLTLEPPLIWTATYQYKKEPVRPADPKMAKVFDRMQLLAGRPKFKTVYVTRDMRHEVIQWMIGRTTENWLTKGYMIFSALNFPEGEVSYIPTEEKIELPTGKMEGRLAAGFDNSNINFPELSWVKPALLAGKVRYQGVEANYYVNPPPKDKKTEPAPGTEPAPNLPEGPKSEAWIDAGTGFPIAMENSNVRVTYEILKRKPSPADMTMSPDFEKVWKGMKEVGLFE